LPVEPEAELPVIRPDLPEDVFTVERAHDGWRVRGRKVERLTAMTYWNEPESVERLQRILSKLGVFEALRAAGIKEGDPVHIGNWHHADEIVRLAQMVVCARPGFKMDVGQMMALLNQLPALLERLTFVEMPELAIAASDLQQRVRSGQSIRYLVPDSVCEYITEQGLYVGGD